MSVAELGAGWFKQRKDKDGNPVKDKNGKDIWNISIQIDLPFLGKAYFMLVPNDDEKKSDKAPAWKVLWWPEREQSAGKPGGSNGPSYGPSGGQGDRDPNIDDGPGY
jgi:hypothetical protein